MMGRGHAKPMCSAKRDQLTGIIVVEEEHADDTHGLLEQVLVGKVDTFIHKQEFYHAGNKYQYRQ
jgi:hypothetical protein